MVYTSVRLTKRSHRILQELKKKTGISITVIIEKLADGDIKIK